MPLIQPLVKTKFLLFLAFLATEASAQQESSIRAVPQGGEEAGSTGISQQELLLSRGLFYISIVAFATLAVLFFLNRTKSNSIEIVKYFCVLFIILGALFLVAAGYGNEQISPIVGLLGTVAGYMLGNAKSKSD